MCRLGWVVPFLLAGCSTAPVAGLKDTIDSHRRGRAERDEPRPPPGGVYDPVSRPKSRQPEALPVSHVEPADDESPIAPKPKPKGFDPADKVKRQQQAPPPPPKKAVDPDDDPPPKPKPKGFDPANKVKPPPATRDDAEPPAASDRRPPAQPASRPAPSTAPRRPPAADERDDF